MKKLFFLLCMISVSGSTFSQNENAFITVNNGKLIKNGQPYYFLGTNLWYAMHLGADGEKGRERLKRELNQLKDMGITNLRVMAGFEGPETEPWRATPAVQEKIGTYNEDLLQGLDFLLLEMQKRDMTAVICLNNFFQWSGGMAQYVSWVTGTEIPYPHDENYSWDEFQSYSAQFYSNKKAKKFFKKFIRKIVKRKNTLTGEKYKEDPAILAWQLANEPRGYGNVEAYLDWVEKTAHFLQKKDKNHLVSLGGEGTTSNEYAGTAFEEIASCEYLDYLTAHLWIENWSWYEPQEPENTFHKALDKARDYIKYHVNLATNLNKPIVFEEFGISRDGFEHHPEGTTHYRDEYYRFVFDYLLSSVKEGMSLAGSNFWSWGGEGRPKNPGNPWKIGEPLIGDPPHENQGWYSVYDKDFSTLEVLKEYAMKFNELKEKPTMASKEKK